MKTGWIFGSGMGVSPMLWCSTGGPPVDFNFSLIGNKEKKHGRAARATKSLYLKLACCCLLIFISVNPVHIAHADPLPATVPTTRPATAPATRPWVEPPIPAVPGDHKLKYRVTLNGHVIELAYLLHLPADYAKNNDRHPLLMFLHGAGECGTDLAGIYVHGPAKLLRDGGNKAFADTCPLIVLSPQCPPHGQRWDQDEIVQATVKLLDHVMEKLRVDRDRVYCTGLSMGGTGTWHVALAAPDHFAAIAPISAATFTPEVAAKVMNYVAVWGITGQNDPGATDATKVMLDALKDSRVEVRRSVMLGQDHGVWGIVYESPQFYEWLLSKRRPSPAERKNLDAARVISSKNSPAVPASGAVTTDSVTMDNPLPTTPGHHLIHIETKFGDQPWRLDCLLFIPRTYRPAGGKSPVLLFLHENDTIGTDVADHCLHGPNAELARIENAHLHDTFPFVLISPLRPFNTTWDNPVTTKAVISVLDAICRQLNVDKTRVEVTGLNAGAAGAWALALAAPDHFAAVAPVVQDGPFMPDPAAAAALMKIAAVVVLRETEAPSIDRLHAIFKTFTAPWKVATMASQKLSSPYEDNDFYQWLAQQHRTP